MSRSRVDALPYEETKTIGLQPEDLTERGVADAFIRRYGPDLLYVETLGLWFIWTGTHFQADHDRTIRHRLGALIQGRAVESLATQDRKLVTLALRALQSRHVHGADHLSRDARDVARVVTQLDPPLTTAHLLNTPGGTIDLPTGVSRPHDRADHFTRVTPVGPAPMATPLWDACLARWTCGRPRLAAYLQRLAGYWLTGEVREHLLVLLLGEGRNGKTTFMTVLMDILGPYATVLSMETLKLQQHPQHPTDLMDLRGARLAIAIETDTDQRLDEARIKALSGGEPVRARYVKKDFVTFPATHKLVIYGNHAPKLRHVSEAIRSRVHLVRFDAVIPPTERDLTLPRKLRAEFPGILQWAVAGAVAYYRDGLQPPPEVLHATTAYLNQEDVLGRWVQEAVVQDPHSHLAKGAAWTAWETWALENGETLNGKPAIPKRLFLQGMTRRFELDEYNRNGERGWIGLRLRGLAEREPDEPAWVTVPDEAPADAD